MSEPIDYPGFLAHLDKWEGENVIAQVCVVGRGQDSPLMQIIGPLRGRHEPTATIVTEMGGLRVDENPGISAYDVAGVGIGIALTEAGYDHGTLDEGVGVGILRAFSAPEGEPGTMLLVTIMTGL